MHRGAMLGVNIGGLLIAGTLAFMPGRIMQAVISGTAHTSTTRAQAGIG